MTNQRGGDLPHSSEAVLEPERPIIDPHHHLWDDARGRYLIDDLAADLNGGHNIRATVFIDCVAMYREHGPASLRPVGEVEFAASVGAESDRRQHGGPRICAGIVGHADLRLGKNVEAVLRAMEDAGGGRFRGIRQMTTHDEAVRLHPSPGLMSDPEFSKGFSRLQELGYSFDAWLYHSQLHELVDLMIAFPEAKVVLNHAGGRIGIGRYADNKEEVWRNWSRDLRRLSKFPNLYVKLGGLGMALGGFGFDQKAAATSAELAAAWRPSIETCIEIFGGERCMFESNFPVDRISCSYVALWNAFKLIAADASSDERTALFHDVAADFYLIGAT